VLVTGGAGFIGRHIVDQLLAGGDDVRVLDRIGPAGIGAGDRRVELTNGDITDIDVVRRALEGVDAVSHQAAMVGLGRDFGDVESYVTNNDLGTAVLLKALWEKGVVGRLVLASSMVVYGHGWARCPVHGIVLPAARRLDDLAAGKFEISCPQEECGRATTWAPVDEQDVTDPRSVYAATKLHQEHLCRAWSAETGASVVCLRYHNVYGPGMPRDTPYAGVAAYFQSALAAGRAPQVFEDGGQTRDFVHVRDVARANVLALHTGQVGFEAYNVASGTARTIGEVAHALTSAFGPGARRPQITGTWRAGDVRHIVASPRKAADRLGFAADISFAEGMAEFAQAPLPLAAG
jgi:dTDP-L-rhamnose 4-epimerase